MRLITSAHYADVAVSVYVKIAALALRPEGCTAATATIAAYLGLSTSSVERGMTQLKRPGPDGVVELSSTRRSLPGGCGTSARRRARPLTSTELFVWIPVAAADDLTPRQLRAYALIAFAQVQHIPLTESEIAGALHHHSGRRAGQSLTTATAGEIVDELEATRWITVERRAGARGRHRFIAHDIPPDLSVATACGQPASPARSASPTSGSGEGSGSSADGGWLATREVPRTDRPDDERVPFSPAVGEVQVDEGVDNPAAKPTRIDAEGGLALRADDNQPPLTNPLTDPLTRSSAAPLTKPNGAYEGPGLTISARVHAVLEPVHWLYRRTSVYMQRRIAREVGRQLRSGIDDTRLRQRLEARVCRIFADEIRDPGRWILGVGLPRWGCGIFDCEAGVLWSSGRRCSVCEEVVHDRRRAAASPEDSLPAHRDPVSIVVPRTVPAVPRAQCRECGCVVFRVNRAVEDGLCKQCRDDQAGVPAGAPVAVAGPDICIGWDDAGCTRPALGISGLCVRCRTRQLGVAAS